MASLKVSRVRIAPSIRCRGYRDGGLGVSMNLFERFGRVLRVRVYDIFKWHMLTSLSILFLVFTQFLFFILYLKSYANAIISSFEDPEKILEQSVLEMNDDLIKMRQATAQVCLLIHFLSSSCFLIHFSSFFYEFLPFLKPSSLICKSVLERNVVSNCTI